jgi:peptidoglycan/LPS O-acetylase OafA/YrhL
VAPILELISRASYWVYIAHLPLVVLLQIAFARVSWPGPLEHAIIVVTTLAACVTSYAAFSWLAKRGSRG